jgi:outer membrane lipoprotein-sorting protein
MNKENPGKFLAGMILAGVALLNITGSVAAQKTKKDPPPSAQSPLNVSRANLAQNASFTVTQTVAPKGGDKLTQTYNVAIKGSKARMDYEDLSVGAVRYVANDRGVFFYIPANKSAMKQTLKGGVEGALKVAFAQYATQLESARKIGTATVSGQPTTIYKDPKSGAVIYLGTKPGFRLPVKAIMENEGGTRTFLVTNIKLNVPLKDDLFVLPAGTQIIDSSDSSGGIPGIAKP